MLYFFSVLLTWNPHCLFPPAEYEDASLSSWVNKERFQGYLQIDGFTLYELGETGAVCLKKKKTPLEPSSSSSFPFYLQVALCALYFSRNFNKHCWICSFAQPPSSSLLKDYCQHIASSQFLFSQVDVSLHDLDPCCNQPPAGGRLAL